MEFNHDILKFWRYRTATVRDVIFKAQLNNMELENVAKFLKNNGYQMDNHIAFQIDQRTFASISDGILRIGKTIEEGNW